VKGRFLVHYDGGPDQGLIKPRDWQLLGAFWKSPGGGGWQQLEVGLHGWFAVVFLCVAWATAAWRFIGIPKRRRRSGRCVRCAYDIKNIPSAVCPECGLAIPPEPGSGRNGSSREKSG